MKYLLSALLAPLLLAAQIEDIQTKNLPRTQLESPKDFSFYTTIGMTTYPRVIIKRPRTTTFLTGVDMGIGTRKVLGQHGWDGVFGIQGNGYFQTFYAQSSYLFYPLTSPGIYLGVGLNFTAGHQNSRYWKVISIPWTLGYQLKNSFMQLRLMRADQLDFGYGFEF